MIVEGLFVAFVMYLGRFFDRVFQLGSRPIILCPMVGLVLGDVEAGTIIGAAVELVFLGAITIGASVPQDVMCGGVLAAAFAILMHQGPDVAVALAIPISLVTVFIYHIVKMGLTALVPFWDKCLEEHNFKRYSFAYILAVALFPLPFSIVTFLCVAFGTASLGDIVNGMPQWVMNSLKIGAGLLPALGFGMLLKMIWEKSIAALFFLGFVLVIYLHLPIMAVAILAGVIAVFYCFQDARHRQELAEVSAAPKADAGVSVEDEKEDFFDD